MVAKSTGLTPKKPPGRPKGCTKPPGSGRKPGQLNSTTKDVREAIAAFAQANVDNMTSWLNQITDPSKKMDLFLRAIEYHIPKLQRSEMVGDPNAPLQVDFSNLKGLTDVELALLQTMLSKANAKAEKQQSATAKPDAKLKAAK